MRHLRCARLLRQSPQHLDAVHPLQLIINDQHVRVVNAKKIQRVLAVERRANLEALGAQQQVDLSHAHRIRDDKHQSPRPSARATLARPRRDVRRLRRARAVNAARLRTRRTRARNSLGPERRGPISRGFIHHGCRPPTPCVRRASRRRRCGIELCAFQTVNDDTRARQIVVPAPGIATRCGAAARA